MSTPPAPAPIPLPDPNPVTQATHRSEVLRQITLPFALALIVVLVLATLSVIATSEAASLWGDISLIFLITIAGLTSFFFLLVLAGLAYALIMLIKALPPRTHLLQGYVWQFERLVRQVSDRIVEPLLKMHSNLAAAAELRRQAGNVVRPDSDRTKST